MTVEDKLQTSTLGVVNGGSARSTKWVTTQSSSRHALLEHLKDDGDESDFELVSTSKHRLDRFSVPGKEDVEEDFLVVSRKPTRRDKGQQLPFLLDDDLEDDVLVVTRKPTVKLLKDNKNDTSIFGWLKDRPTFGSEYELIPVGLVIGVGLACLFYKFCRRERLAQKASCPSSSQEIEKKQELKLSPSGKKQGKSCTDSTDQNTDAINSGHHRERVAATPCMDREELDKNSRIGQDMTPITKDVNEKSISPDRDSSSVSAASSPVQVTVVRSPTQAGQYPKKSNEVSPTATVEVAASFPGANEHTIHAAASQLAKDIKVVQQAFEKEGVDPTLASQMTAALYSSRHQLLAQERHFAWQQHFHTETQEALASIHDVTSNSADWDRNWKDKLRKQRDQCWNAAFRLMWELAMIHLLFKLAKPVVPIILSNNGSFTSLYTMAQLCGLVFTSLCTCIESSEVVELSSASSSWLFFDKWGTFGLFGQIAGWEPTIIMEQGMCYGNCALHLMILLGMAVIGHKIVRAFSAPSILHPFINVWAVTSVAGASNPKDWILRIWKTRPAVSGLTILSILGMFIMVQLTYNNYRKSFEKCPERDFRQKWDECLDGMSALHFWIYCTRYGIFAIFTASLWVQNMGL